MRTMQEKVLDALDQVAADESLELVLLQRPTGQPDEMAHFYLQAPTAFMTLATGTLSQLGAGPSNHPLPLYHLVVLSGDSARTLSLQLPGRDDAAMQEGRRTLAAFLREEMRLSSWEGRPAARGRSQRRGNRLG